MLWRCLELKYHQTLWWVARRLPLRSQQLLVISLSLSLSLLIYLVLLLFKFPSNFILFAWYYSEVVITGHLTTNSYITYISILFLILSMCKHNINNHSSKRLLFANDSGDLYKLSFYIITHFICSLSCATCLF